MKQQVEQIISGVCSLALTRQAAFVLACAQRVSPAAVGLASARSAQIYKEALDAAWTAIKSSGTHPELRQERKALSELPEASVDDSLRPDYYAMIAMYPLEVALALLAGDQPEDAVGSVCFCAVNLCAELDADTATHFIAHDQPLEHSPLETAELAAQLATLHVLQAESPLTEATCERIRQQAVDASRAIERAIPHFAKERGWRA